ncbi:MAG: preprotein translocase subunit SecG [Clostridia bacterium]|nr:preprotein translocase subunit SecG [Clostridia bacterium]
MGIWEIVVGALVLLLSIIMIIVIILQEGHQAGLGAVTGGADSFLSRGKARTADAIFARVTRFCAILFFILVVLLNALAFFNLRGDIIGGDSENNAVVAEQNDALVSEDETSAKAETEESEEEKSAASKAEDSKAESSKKEESAKDESEAEESKAEESASEESTANESAGEESAEEAGEGSVDEAGSDENADQNEE